MRRSAWGKDSHPEYRQANRKPDLRHASILEAQPISSDGRHRIALSLCEADRGQHGFDRDDELSQLGLGSTLIAKWNGARRYSDDQGRSRL